MDHEWIPSPLGHGETMCRRCMITNREAAVLDLLHVCDPPQIKPTVIAPKGATSNKPPHGAPCNRCGWCCVATLCPLAEQIFGGKLGPCPALRYDDKGSSSCGMIDDPMKYAPRIALEHGVAEASRCASLLVGAGTGCDARINGEPANQEFYNRLRQWDFDNRSKTRRAKKVWKVLPLP